MSRMPCGQIVQVSSQSAGWKDKYGLGSGSSEKQISRSSWWQPTETQKLLWQVVTEKELIKKSVVFLNGQRV